MPINVQLLLRESCGLARGDGITEPLTQGGRTFTQGAEPYVVCGPDGSRIRIEGLPASQHHMEVGDGRAITGVAEQRCHRLMAGVFTPADCVIRLSAICPNMTQDSGHAL